MTRLLGMPDEAAEGRLTLYRRIAGWGIISFFMLAPAISLLGDSHQAPGRTWFLFGGSVVFVILTFIVVIVPGAPGAQPVPWAALAVVLGLGVTLFVVGRENWLTVLAVAAAACGRYSGSRRPAVIGAAVCALAGLAVAIHTNASFGNTLALVAIAPLSAFFAYGAGKRIDMVNALRRTRAELARAAVAEERLRIARDLHDLLGHSLSLITLKAELAGRVIGTDQDRAAKEISELESIARQSLSDVREAVAGFRQPDLAGELAAARQLLDAAGITTRITSAGPDGLPQAVDAALAWAVREGATNVVRHSNATQVLISVSVGPAAVVAEITDNGPAAPDETGLHQRQATATAGPDGRAVLARPVYAGSGLAGLAERVRSLGGELAAGAVDGQGFLLRVAVPLTPQA